MCAFPLTQNETPSRTWKSNPQIMGQSRGITYAVMVRGRSCWDSEIVKVAESSNLEPYPFTPSTRSGGEIKWYSTLSCGSLDKALVSTRETSAPVSHNMTVSVPAAHTGKMALDIWLRSASEETSETLFSVVSTAC